MNSERTITVVGAGIFGLSTANELLDRGWKVTIVAPSKDPVGGDWTRAYMIMFEGVDDDFISNQGIHE